MATGEPAWEMRLAEVRIEVDFIHINRGTFTKLTYSKTLDLSFHKFSNLFHIVSAAA